MNKIGRYLKLGLITAIVTGIAAFMDELDKQKQEKTIDDLQNRIQVLESSKKNS